MINAAYGLALILFPPPFRAAFGECMQADFADGLRDAQRATRRGYLATWIVRVAWDLVRAISWQWARTSVPWLTVSYAVAILTICEGLSSILLRSRLLWHVTGPLPSSGWYLTGSVLNSARSLGADFCRMVHHPEPPPRDIGEHSCLRSRD